MCGLFVFAFTTISYWREPKITSPFMAIGKHIEMSTNKEDIILSDIAWEMTWYANRKTIWLPYDMNTLRRITKTLSPQYLLLSGSIVGRSYPYGPFGPYKDNMWAKMVINPSYAEDFGFKLQNVIFMNNIPVAFMFKMM